MLDCLDILEKQEVPIVEVNSLSEFTSTIEEIAHYWRKSTAHEKNKVKTKSTGDPFPGELVPWFRGITRKMYDLEPTLLRKKSDVGVHEYVKRVGGTNKEAVAKLEGYMMRRFSTAGIRFTDLAPPKTQDIDIQWMMLMQHAGLPTRLLDWSKSALIALYYAIRGYTSKQDNFDSEIGLSDDYTAVVWALDPRSLQDKCCDTRKICTELDPEVENYIDLEKCSDDSRVNIDYPLPIIPSHLHERIVAQQARFTLHTHEEGGIKRFAKDLARESNGYSALIGIEIPLIDQEKMFRTLRLLGVTEQEITPSLDSIAIEIKDRIRLGSNDSLWYA